MMRERILTLVAFNVRVEDHAMAALATLNVNLKLLVRTPATCQQHTHSPAISLASPFPAIIALVVLVALQSKQSTSNASMENMYLCAHSPTMSLVGK